MARKTANATVSENGQVTIPGEIRRRLGIVPGTNLGIGYAPLDRDSALIASRAWRRYHVVDVDNASRPIS